MAIIKELAITVKGRTASLSEDVYLYAGDGGITLLISITEDHYKFGSFGDNGVDLVEESDTKWASVCVLKANDEVVSSERCEIIDNKIKFDITKDFIDEVGEIGEHSLQVHLYDGEDEQSNRLTIPPVSFTILEPICNKNKEE